MSEMTVVSPLGLELWVPALAWVLLNFVWQGLIVGGLAWGSLALLGKASPRARYAICAWALLACLALPLMHLAWILGSPQALPQQAEELPAWLRALALQSPALVGAWSLGVSVMALRLGAGLAWVAMLRGRAGPAPAVWQLRLDALALRLGIRRRLVLQLLPDLSGPVTVGFLRPLVLLPTALLSGMPPALLEALLAHELAHVRRWDYLANLLQSLVETLLFFHPVVWWLSSELRDAREEVADELAAAAVDDPRRLATALQALVSLQQDLRVPNLALAAGGGKLLQRLERLLAPPAQSAGWKIAFAALALACTSVWMQARTQQTQTQTLAKAPAAATAAAADIAATPVMPSMRQLLQLPVNARHALVLDESSGEIVMAKDADAAVPIASITKLMTAMVVLDAKPDLGERLRVEAGDLNPQRPSAAHLPIGATLSRLSALELTLMPSDNRAAATLARDYAGGMPAFVRAMQAKAQSLGLSHTVFVDPAGVSPGNVSTATEVARIVAAASHYPEIARISSGGRAEVPVGGRALAVRNTNPLVGDDAWDIQLSKTGYTKAAGSCLTMRFKTGGQQYTLVLLDGDGAAERQSDATHIRAKMATIYSS